MTEKDKVQYSFPPSVTIADCAAILKEVNDIIQDNENEVILDAAQVESVDTAGVQLIISICHQQFNKHELKDCLNMSDNLKMSVERLGI